LALITLSSQLLHHHDWLCLFPQTLETIKLALFRREDVNDHISKIQQDPAGFGGTLNARIPGASGDKLVVDRSKDRSQLPLVSCRANNKVIRDCGRASEIKQHDLTRLPVFGYGHYAPGQCYRVDITTSCDIIYIQ
jgi:hypothetical protein